MNTAKDDKSREGANDAIRTTVTFTKDDYRIVRVAAAYLDLSTAQFMANAILDRARMELSGRGASA
jgi:uncharacterized protein (DUF1778 family)